MIKEKITSHLKEHGAEYLVGAATGYLVRGGMRWTFESALTVTGGPGLAIACGAGAGFATGIVKEYIKESKRISPQKNWLNTQRDILRQLDTGQLLKAGGKGAVAGAVGGAGGAIFHHLLETGVIDNAWKWLRPPERPGLVALQKAATTIAATKKGLDVTPTLLVKSAHAAVTEISTPTPTPEPALESHASVTLEPSPTAVMVTDMFQPDATPEPTNLSPTAQPATTEVIAQLPTATPLNIHQTTTPVTSMFQPEATDQTPTPETQLTTVPNVDLEPKADPQPPTARVTSLFSPDNLADTLTPTGPDVLSIAVPAGSNPTAVISEYIAQHYPNTDLSAQQLNSVVSDIMHDSSIVNARNITPGTLLNIAAIEEYIQSQLGSTPTPDLSDTQLFEQLDQRVSGLQDIELEWGSNPWEASKQLLMQAGGDHVEVTNTDIAAVNRALIQTAGIGDQQARFLQIGHRLPVDDRVKTAVFEVLKVKKAA